MKEIEVGKNISDLLEVGDIIEVSDSSDKKIIKISNDEILKEIKENIKNGLELNKIDNNIQTIRISYKSR